MQRRLIPDDFIRKLSETIPEGSSALFVLFKSVTEDKVLPEMQPYKPRILKTSLSNEAEAKTKSSLEQGCLKSKTCRASTKRLVLRPSMRAPALMAALAHVVHDQKAWS
jgi:hypothetical protein